MSAISREIERLQTERNRERKHVARLMEERDSARRELEAANGRIIALNQKALSSIYPVLELCKLALEHASFALDGVVSLDEEDEGKDGGSDTCQHAKKTVDRALKKLVASLDGGRE